MRLFGWRGSASNCSLTYMGSMGYQATMAYDLRVTWGVNLLHMRFLWGQVPQNMSVN